MLTWRYLKREKMSRKLEAVWQIKKKKSLKQKQYI
jgi:hypothetical protein